MITMTDRKLGDEWEEWDGDFSRLETDVETGKRVFLGFTVLSIFMVAIATAFFWYLIKPRIQQLSPSLAQLMEYAVLIFIFLLFVSFSQMVLSIMIKRDLLIKIRGRYVSLKFLTPLVLKLGEKFGISYDRMGNSFIKVSNSIITTRRRHIANSKILILLPRCLTKTLQNKIKELAKRYQCLIFTVPGGTLARKIIAREKPNAVIGVACERDLMSGIRDVSKIPVIGITNQRPEGPCKNTVVDFDQIEEAIRYFLDQDLGQSERRIAH
ncbi:DUF116 domain-containing protein [candidate division KSB1 bacterium]|nr:DUF116 domain-containing protein [candidate division KSB1 bacterium]